MKKHVRKISDPDRRHLLRTAAAFGALGLLPFHPATAQDIPSLKLRELYTKALDFSRKAQELEGSIVRIRGYMAPPLKADSSFFVLTKRPMAVCPFCEGEADWPDDILAIYTQRTIEVVHFTRPLWVTGELALGNHKDADTGFFSKLRLINARYERA